MSRYPGTQFKVYDKSQVAATVPVSTANGADAVQYLNAFASIKGPENITFCYGNSFYERYGTQNYIDFKKYGQPLFQTSMNINNGAAILAKRAVLDDATLGNATLSVVLTKYKEANIEVDTDIPNLIKSINFKDSDAPIKYSMAPMVFSINNYNNGEFATKQLNEHKERYDLYKNFIIDVVANEDTPDNRFLSKMLPINSPEVWSNVLSGFSQSVYYDKDNHVINVVEEGKNEVRKVTSITTGKINGQMQTYSSIFDTSDITEDLNRNFISDIKYTDPFYTGTTGGYTFMKYVVTETTTTDQDTGLTYTTYSGEWVPDTSITDVNFKNVALYINSIDRIVSTFDELNSIQDETWDSKDYYDAQNDPDTPYFQRAIIAQAKVARGESAITIPGIKYNETVRFTTNTGDKFWTNLLVNLDTNQGETVDVVIAANGTVSFKSGNTTIDTASETIDGNPNPNYNKGYAEIVTGAWVAVPDKDKIVTKGYTDVIRLINDVMTSRSGYIIAEWIFPMFTIFDNGRGLSTKSISIEYDKATSTAMKRAIYKLNVYNYDTSRRLESFYFSLNPYSTNDNTGYAFDIESTVNYNSNQISVNTYYESFEALTKTLQEITGSNEDLIGTYDILFGHDLTGKYKAYNSYSTSNLLKRVAYVYDYAHLDVFDNDIITVNAYCDSDNMLDTSDPTDIVKYYYYNWIRTNKNLIERLEYGSDGYNLARRLNTPYGNKNTTKLVPFFAVDSTNPEMYDIPDSKTKKHGDSIIDIMEKTGQRNGTIISSDTFNLNDEPYIHDNFVTVKLAVSLASMYTADSIAADTDASHTGTAKGKTPCYICPNDKARKMRNVFFASEYGRDSDTIASRLELAEAAAQTYAINNPTEYAVAYQDLNATVNYTVIDVTLPLTPQKLYQRHYYRLYSGEFDRDIFNLDIYFPNAIFDANYDNEVKLAIQRLVAYRGDLMAYMDMGIDKVRSYEDCTYVIPATDGGLDLTAETSEYSYIRDMHIAVCCLYYKIRNPYDNRVITVTGTYGLSNLYIGHFRNDVGKVFAGISNGIAISNIIYGTVNYIPKIYPTSEMTSLNNIGGVYPSDDATIVNEKQLMCDLRVNYGCYYDDRFSIETEYTMNAAESEFSYWNNVALVCMMMQAIRKACPSARYQFITANDLSVYQAAVENAMKPWRNKFAYLSFRYIQDENALANKIFYAAIEVAFKPFAQAEIFELTALNYSTLSSEVTSV